MARPKKAQNKGTSANMGFSFPKNALEEVRASLMGEEEITRVVFRKWRTGAIHAAVVALVVAFLLLPTVSIAKGDPEPLRGLKGVHVLVENIDSQAERLGLTRAQIQTDVELRLRKAGVRVLTEKERLETPGCPHLYVNINTPIGQGLVVYSISVELFELVTLARGFVTDGAIWNIRFAGCVGTSNIRKVREGVGDCVDKFINDYLAANPK